MRSSCGSCSCGWRREARTDSGPGRRVERDAGWPSAGWWDAHGTRESRIERVQEGARLTSRCTPLEGGAEGFRAVYGEWLGEAGGDGRREWIGKRMKGGERQERYEGEDSASPRKSRDARQPTILSSAASSRTSACTRCMRRAARKEPAPGAHRGGTCRRACRHAADILSAAPSEDSRAFPRRPFRLQGRRAKSRFATWARTPERARWVFCKERRVWYRRHQAPRCDGQRPRSSPSSITRSAMDTWFFRLRYALSSTGNCSRTNCSAEPIPLCADTTLKLRFGQPILSRKRLPKASCCLSSHSRTTFTSLFILPTPWRSARRVSGRLRAALLSSFLF